MLAKRTSNGMMTILMIMKTDEEIRLIANEIFSRPEFNPQTPWLIQKWTELWEKTLEYVEKLLTPLTSTQPTLTQIKVFGYFVWALIIVLFFIMAWRVYRHFRRKNLSRKLPARVASGIDWEQKSYLEAAAGNFRQASICLFVAVLSRLQEKRFINSHSVRTGRSILRELDKTDFIYKDLMEDFFASYYKISYDVILVDEKKWNSFLKQGKVVLKSVENYDK